VSPIKGPKSPANWPKIMNESDFDEIIDEPLLTDDGLLNPVCLAQLDAAIKNMPPTHERLAGDGEWNTPRWTFLREITGYLAHWAVRQIGCERTYDKTPFPPKLENVVGYLDACIRPRFDRQEMALLSLCDISRMLHEILMEEKFFLAWNDSTVLVNWLDLDALIHNVCVSIRNERRAFDAFDKAFEEDWERDHGAADLGAGI
jgi:hypothetical protein